MNSLLAVAPVAMWGLEQWVIFLIVIAAALGILYAVCQYYGFPIPPIFLRIVGIVLVAAFAILAIRFLFSL